MLRVGWVLFAEIPTEDGVSAFPFTSVVALLVAVVGLGKPVLEFLQTRAASSKPTIPSQDSTVELISLETEPVRHRTSRRWLYDKIVAATTGAFATVLAVYFIVELTDADGLPARAFTLATSVVYVLVASLNWWQFLAILPKQAGEVLYCCKADLRLQGDVSEIISRCKDALAILGALRARGSRVAVTPGKAALLEGGTGRWPTRGQGYRVTVSVRIADDSCYRVIVESACYWPHPFAKRRNDRNVRMLLQRLI